MKCMKTVLLGLDGCTWRLLRGYVKRGVMEHLGSLMNEGAYGVLWSTIPPVTGAAWPAMATGLNPGKTGIVDFLVRRSRNSLELGLVSSRDYRGRAFWDLLSAMGENVSVYFYPITFPPYPVRGVLVTGFGSPGDEPFSYPEHVAKRIVEMEPGFTLYLRYYRYSSVEEFVEAAARHLGSLIRIARGIVFSDRRLADHVSFVVSTTDWIMHRLWHLMDPGHPMYREEEARRYRRLIDELWGLVDEIVGLVGEVARSEEAVLFIVSDHGFGPNTGVFNLLKWLSGKGYVRFRVKGLFIRALIARLMDFVVNSGLVKYVERVLPRKRGGGIGASGILDLVDLSQSKAIDPGHTNEFGAIYLLREKPRLREKLIRELSSLREVLGLSVEILSREEIYNGPWLELLPDIIISIEGHAVSIAKDIHHPLYEEKPWRPTHTGSHRRDGILLVSSSNVKQVRELEASIYDIAPTILLLHGLPIPRDIDGKPLEEVFRNGIERPRYVDRKFYDARTKLFWKLKKRKTTEKN